jgi:ABC-type dipeptide/oligopeptide/nickel transport system permease subunit
MALTLLVQLGIFTSLPSLLYPVMAVYLISSTLTVLFRPYKEFLHNLGVHLLDFNVLYALVLPLLNIYLSLSEDSAVFLVFILEGLLIIAFLLTLARLIRAYYMTIKGRDFEENAKKRSEKGTIME